MPRRPRKQPDDHIRLLKFLRRESSLTTESNASRSPDLIRGMGLGSAVALNMIEMIGVGPFITLPLIVAAMGGEQALLGWVLGALFMVCDGMLWAELGAAMPETRRIVLLPQENLRSQPVGAIGFVSFYMAAHLQRAAIHRIRMHWPGPLRWILVSRLTADPRPAQFPCVRAPWLQRSAHCVSRM
jgi:hypothetical protein